MKLTAELPDAAGAWGRIELREYRRAHTLLDDAGILIKQAARLPLGLPAAGPSAEREMVAQALAVPDADDVAQEPVQHDNGVWALDSPGGAPVL